MDVTTINKTVLKDFINKFLGEIEEYKKLFKELKLNIKNYLPEIFTYENLGVQVLYSNDTQHIFSI
ncbi:MAG: hypothetical protein Q8929_06605 [Bacillota bacterium]|nr:hypothetical protein [Bacillota bacterium]